MKTIEKLKYWSSQLFYRFLSEPHIKRLIMSRVLTRNELLEYVPASKQIIYDQAEIIDIQGPISLQSYPSEIQTKLGRNKIDPPFVCELSDAELVGPHALTITSNHKYVLENSLGSLNGLARSVLKAVFDGVLPHRKNPNHTVEIAVSLVGPWCRGYYHWFSDYLLQLKGIEAFTELNGDKPKVIVPPNMPHWMESSLKLIGFNNTDLLKWTGDRVRVNRLVVPSLRRQTEFTDYNKGFMFSPSAYKWLSSSLRDSVNTEISSSNRIYISREKAAQRRVVNRNEVLAVLDEYGFEPYVLEDLSFKRQVALLSDADAIVGPSGAGMVNMMYADDPMIITLFGSPVNACYPVMAESLGFDTGILLNQPRGLDMQVDTDRLSELLDRML